MAPIQFFSSLQILSLQRQLLKLFLAVNFNICFHMYTTAFIAISWFVHFKYDFLTSCSRRIFFSSLISPSLQHRNIPCFSSLQYNYIIMSKSKFIYIVMIIQILCTGSEPYTTCHFLSNITYVFSEIKKVSVFLVLFFNVNITNSFSIL